LISQSGGIRDGIDTNIARLNGHGSRALRWAIELEKSNNELVGRRARKSKRQIKTSYATKVNATAKAKAKEKEKKTEKINHSNNFTEGPPHGC